MTAKPSYLIASFANETSMYLLKNSLNGGFHRENHRKKHFSYL